MFQTILAIIGFFTALYNLSRFQTFISHYAQESKLPDYLRDDSWALVTGASDGIGYGFVEELADRGFNVILHGRSQSKLEDRIKQLKHKYAKVKFQYVVADATVTGDAAISQIEKLISQLPANVTVLVNNVGGAAGGHTFDKFVNRSLREIAGSVAINATFAILLTAAILPKLIRAQPALIVNVGSVMDMTGAAYVEPYSGCKAHNRGFSEALRMEMKLEGYKVEVMHLRVLSVATPGSGHVQSWMNVAPRTMARGALDRVGSGVSSTNGCLRHAIIVWAMETFLPKAWVAQMVSGQVRAMIVPRKVD